MRYRLFFANSVNTTYTPEYYQTSDFFGPYYLNMLKYVNEKLHDKSKKLYFCFIYDEQNKLIHSFKRGKSIQKIIDRIEKQKEIKRLLSIPFEQRTQKDSDLVKKLVYETRSRSIRPINRSNQ
jgi:hypothetical protein